MGSSKKYKVSSKYLMMFAIVLLVFLPFALSFDYSIYEQGAFNYLIPESLRTLEASLKESLSPAEDHIIRGMSFAFQLQELKSFTMQYKDYTNQTLKGNTLIYELSRPFTFDVGSKFSVSYGLIHVSGICTLNVFVESMVYKLTVEKQELVPSFTAKLKFSASKIQNSIAVELNIKKHIENLGAHIEKPFIQFLEKGFKEKVKAFYKERYFNSGYHVHFPYLGNSSVNVKSKQNGFAVLQNNHGGILRANYDQDVTKSTLKQTPEIKFTRCFQFQVDELIEILKQGLENAKDIKLTSKMIPTESYFRLDSASLSRIYSDLIYQPTEITGVVTFNAQANVVGSYLEQKKVFMFLVPKVNVGISLNDEAKTQLVDVVLDVTGEFTPVFTQAEEETLRVFMGLNAQTVNIVIREAKDTWNNEHAVLNVHGLKNFFNDMVKEYFIRFHSKELLGTGMLVSMGMPLRDYEIFSTGGTSQTICFE